MADRSVVKFDATFVMIYPPFAADRKDDSTEPTTLSFEYIKPGSPPGGFELYFPDRLAQTVADQLAEQGVKAAQRPVSTSPPDTVGSTSEGQAILQGLPPVPNADGVRIEVVEKVMLSKIEEVAVDVRLLDVVHQALAERLAVLEKAAKAAGVTCPSFTGVASYGPISSIQPDPRDEEPQSEIKGTAAGPEKGQTG